MGESTGAAGPASKRLTAAVLVVGLLQLAVVPWAPDARAVGADRTSPQEAARVDRVKAPRLGWTSCAKEFDAAGAECATANLPLDYDAPDGARTRVALLRIKTAKPTLRIGTLFVNPGGPSGSGTDLAASARTWLSRAVLDRFDIVGVDPRGTNHSANVRCWKGTAAQAAVLTRLDDMAAGPKKVPVTAIEAAKAMGRACSTTGRPLSGSMSTAEVARDMDVLRRAIGDRKLNYFGFSYGTYLGQVYANMFPDRVRAIAIDGVIEPVAWVGSAKSAGTPLFVRTGADRASARALDAIVARCAAAGPRYCRLAGLGDPAKVVAKLVARAKKAPLVVVRPGNPGSKLRITYRQLYGMLLGSLYDLESPGKRADEMLSALARGVDPTEPVQQREAAYRTLEKAIAGISDSVSSGANGTAARSAKSVYRNDLEAVAGVACTDGRHGRRVGDWPGVAGPAPRPGAGFTEMWGWLTAQCATSTWTVQDEDAYRGPFTRRTAAPVLVVGNHFDPATSYSAAVAAAKLLPNSRLLSSNTFGHTAYGTSACVTGAVDRYLIGGRLPAKGTLCRGPQPFRTALKASAARGTDPSIRSAVRPPLPFPAVGAIGAIGTNG